jgi:phosphate butyryltransferase
MAARKLNEILSLVRRSEPLTVMVVSANDVHTISAVNVAIDENLIKAILIGNQTEINLICLENDIDTSRFRIIHQPNDNEAALLAIELIKKGEADILMKGLISTDQFIKAILNKENGLVDPGKLLSHVTIIENSNYHKLMIAGDVAVIPQPNISQKVMIINYLVKTANALQIRNPKVACIAPTEKVIPSISSTTDAELLSEMYKSAQIQDCIVEGPIALDVALDAEAALIKGISNPVAGDADCLLFSNIDAGNVFYKTNTKLAQSETAAILVGAKVPVVLASRGDSILTKLYSIALGALIARTDNLF